MLPDYKFRMLFPAVLLSIPNSKVCLKGGWSIESFNHQIGPNTELSHIKIQWGWKEGPERVK